MPKTVRCMFNCTAVSKRTNWDRSKKGLLYTAEFSACTDGTEEVKKFFDATPHGKLEVGTFNEDLFQPGKTYYLDISEVPAAEPTPA